MLRSLHAKVSIENAILYSEKHLELIETNEIEEGIHFSFLDEIRK
jgi:hypothetical protein